MSNNPVRDEKIRRPTENRKLVLSNGLGNYGTQISGTGKSNNKLMQLTAPQF